MYQSWSFEKWQIVNVAERKGMTLVEIGTGPVGLHVVGIGDREIAARRSILDRVTVSVRQIEEQASEGLAQAQLKSVIDRGSGLVLTLDSTHTDVRPEGIRNHSA